MKLFRLLLVSLAVLAAISAEAAITTLNLNARLYTQTSIIDSPLTVSYDAESVSPWKEEGYTIATPDISGLTASLRLAGMTFTEKDDIDYPVWPGLILKDGDPFAFDFCVVDPPLPGVWRLGAAGLITNGNVQAFLDLYDTGPVGFASAPVPAEFAMALVPEPRQYAMLGGLTLIGFLVVRRFRC